ncbi:MAG: M48 family metalloprotease [Sedimentisphaerales bacterium]|nr:M48 family metalloprotease [Sedimentisphaerales bacterium]
MIMSLLERLLSQGMVERLGWMLVHFLWQGVAVALLLAILLRLLRKSNANVRYLAACSALALMVVLPVATVRLVQVTGPAAEAARPPTAVSAGAPLGQIQAVDPLPASTQPADSLPDTDSTSGVAWGERIASALRPALPYAVLAWLAGVFGLSAWHLAGWMQLQRFRRRMVHGVDAVLRQQMVQTAERLGVRRAVTLLESALVEVPTVVGWLRPVVLLPVSALSGLSADQLEAILAHELAHIRRCDYLVNIAQTIVEILGFYHPAVWRVSRKIRIERENCCDDAAVRVCGDSIRYARALTSLEAIRHSQAELAIAATGGSLLDRIARLLGRPVPDDRRLAWLPGLIALLLVVAITIPAALTLAASAPDQSDARSADAVASIPQAQDGTQANDPNDLPFLLDFIIAEVFSDTRLDQDTAAKVAGLLRHKPAGDTRRTAGLGTPPTIEEVQQPLGDVLARFTPAPGKSEHFMDWLVSRGYAQTMFAPRLAVTAGHQASITVGSEPDPNTAQPRRGEVSFLRLNVTANRVRDPNATLLSVDFTMRYFPSDAGDPDRETTTSHVSSMLVVPNNQYRLISDPTIMRVDENGRKHQSMLMVRSAILQEPQASPPQRADESPASEPNAPKVNVTTATPGEPNAAEVDKAHIQVAVKIVRATDGKELDQKAVLRVEKILGKRVRPEGQAGELGPGLHLTVGEVFRNHILGQPLPRETLDALLPALGDEDMTVLACPQVTVRDQETCQMKITDREHFYPAPSAGGAPDPTKLEKVEAGTTVEVTPHITDHDNVTMDITVETSDFVQPSAAAEVPIVTRQTTKVIVTTRNSECVTLSGMKADNESVYIMAIPTIVKAPADGNDVHGPPIGTGGMGGFGAPSDETGGYRVSPIEVNTRAVADPVSTKQWTSERTAYVNSDPVYKELARSWVELWKELAADRQRFAPEHPELIRKQSLLDALTQQMNETKRRLEREFDERLAAQTAAPSVR